LLIGKLRKDTPVTEIRDWEEGRTKNEEGRAKREERRTKRGKVSFFIFRFSFFLFHPIASYKALSPQCIRARASGNEGVDGEAIAQALPGLGRGNVEGRQVEPLPADINPQGLENLNGGGRIRYWAAGGAWRNKPGAAGNQILATIPARQRGEGILPDNPKPLVITACALITIPDNCPCSISRIGCLHLFEQVDGVGAIARCVGIDPPEGEAIVGGDRPFHQLQSMGDRQQILSLAMRRHHPRNPQHPVELRLVQSGLCDVQMPLMGRVKRASKNAQVLHRSRLKLQAGGQRQGFSGRISPADFQRQVVSSLSELIPKSGA
jgi:hypothetical protein